VVEQAVTAHAVTAHPVRHRLGTAARFVGNLAASTVTVVLLGADAD
jgi:hypothetical protein